MKYPLMLILAVASLATLAGCGSGQDRVLLARQTVVTYWSDIGHGRVKQAYNMNVSGTRAQMTFGAFQQNIFSFLTSTNGIYASAGKATVTDDRATVQLDLHSPKAPGAFHVWQHLFWENGSWKIADLNGGVSSTK